MLARVGSLGGADRSVGSLPWWGWGIALALYLLAALFAMGRVLPDAGNLLIGLEEGSAVRLLDRTDQQMVLSTVVGNARRLVDRPASLRDEGQCFPMPRSYALGEHMFGEGLLATPVWWLTGEPILAYNSMLVLRLWIAAVAMFAFLLYVTRNPWAAFVGGLLFGLSPYRLTDPVHPFVHADLWVPLALLCVHRLYEGAGWGTALALGVTVSLTVLESIYPLVAAAIVLSVYTTALAIRFPARLPHVVPRVACALLLPVATAWYVLVPYLQMAATWEVLSGVRPVSGVLRDFWPGGLYFPGALLLVLAALGLADRLRGARPTAAGDPRLPIFLAGFLCLWSSIYGLPIPFTDFSIPSPLRALIGIVPGLDAARAMVLVKIGVVPALAILAGYGTLALLERISVPMRFVGVALLSLFFFVESFLPAVAGRLYGHRPPFQAYPAALVGTYRDFVEQLTPPVLDVPMKPGELALQGHYLHWATYHGGDTAACYNSFVSPVQRAMAEVADRLPARSAQHALGALGVKTVVVHAEGFDDVDREDRMNQFFETAGPGFTQSAREGAHAVFQLDTPGRIDSSFDALQSVPEELPFVEVHAPRGEIPFVFTAREGAVYRHPDPIEPSELLLRWQRDGGMSEEVQVLRRLLPLAIAGEDYSVRTLSVPVSQPSGWYRVTLARAEEPERVLAERRVRVLEAPEG